MTNKFKNKYLVDISRLTGLTIFLVVVGHLVTGQDINTPGLEWYKFLKRYIYAFHMPLFMFISGFLFYYTLPDFNSFDDYKNFVSKKIRRLMPSFLVFAIIIFVIKFLLSNQVKVDNGVNSYSEFFKVFYDPVGSFAGFLWYIYVLFQFYLVFPIILKYVKPIIIVLIAFGLYFVEITNLFAIDFFLKYFLFFSLGVLAVHYYDVYTSILEKYKYLFLLLFLGCSIGFYFIVIPKLIFGIVSIIGLHALILIVKPTKFKILSTLGVYSFSIYLMNTLVMGFVKAIGFKFFEISYSNFLFIALLMVFLGSIIPILIKKYFLNNIPVIGKYLG